MEKMKKLRNGGGASPLNRNSKGFEKAARGICLFDDAVLVARMKRRYGLCLRKALQPLLAPALTSGSAMVSKTYPPSGMYGVGEQLIKCQKGICHPELVSGSHKEIPNRVRNDKKVKAAFTLAEVLITLGIIGVVAAMTIPTLISNYQKKITVTKLKQTYSILSQALKMAQAEHGDPNTWSIAGVKGSSALDEGKREEIVTNFMATYIHPYIKVVKDYGYKSYPEHGYDGPNFPDGGLVSSEQNTKGDAFVLQNGVWVMGLISTTGCLRPDPDNPDVCLERNFDNVLFVTDVNGADTPPNAFGKDLFYIFFDNSKPSVTMVSGTGLTRDDYMERCEQGGSSVSSVHCGAVIFLDGFEIKDDYPWL